MKGSSGDIQMTLNGTDYPDIGQAWYISTQGTAKPGMKWVGNDIAALDFLDHDEYEFTTPDKQSVRLKITTPVGNGKKQLGTERIVGSIDCPRT
jgi:hypothetical protein